MLLKYHSLFSQPSSRYILVHNWSDTGGTPSYKLYRQVAPQRVWSLRRFGLKTGINFAHFGLELGMGTAEVYEHIYRFNSKWIRKKYANSKRIFRNRFVGVLI